MPYRKYITLVDDKEYQFINSTFREVAPHTIESTLVIQPRDSVVATNQLRASRSPSDRASLDMPVSVSPLPQDQLS